MSKSISKNQTQSVEQVVYERIITLLNRRKDHSWSGTMTQLNRAITTGLRRSLPENWPGSPSALRRVVNKTVRSLKRSGVEIQFGRTTDSSRTRFVEFVYSTKA